MINADHFVPVKKSIGLMTAKNSSVSNARTAMIEMVVTTPSAAAPKSSRSMIRSLSGRLWRRVVAAVVIGRSGASSSGSKDGDAGPGPGRRSQGGALGSPADGGLPLGHLGRKERVRLGDVADLGGEVARAREVEVHEGLQLGPRPWPRRRSGR